MYREFKILNWKKNNKFLDFLRKSSIPSIAGSQSFVSEENALLVTAFQIINAYNYLFSTSKS